MVSRPTYLFFCLLLSGALLCWKSHSTPLPAPPTRLAQAAPGGNPGGNTNPPANPPANNAPNPLDTAPTTQPRVHDPAIASEDGVFYVFSTGPGLVIHTSKDLIHWQRAGRVFENPLLWAQQAVPGFKDYIWAPDIAFFNGKWHLYYSVSTFGKNLSAIGVATNETLDPAKPHYRWVDEGLVFASKPGDDFNAIDPNVVFDADGHLWLDFGSFWSGIKLRRLDEKTGKLSAQDTRLYALASRPHQGGIEGSVEAPFIIRQGEFYYLFVSFDFCCRGVNSTYNIRVGRAPRIDGPYVDRDGKPLLDGGGTLLVGTQGTTIGPGHCSVLRHNTGDFLVYHFYDGTSRGRPAIQVRPLHWTPDGWPQVEPPLQAKE